MSIGKKSDPQRRCVGCGQMKPKNTLLRMVKSPDGTVRPDPGGKLPGRGAYLCRSGQCLEAARKKRQLERAFSMKISEETYDEIKEAVGK